ncbi:cytochrome P450 [Syncephalis fuscata]|nr:cytochrome P450 [Syncephalis fuscata]
MAIIHELLATIAAIPFNWSYIAILCGLIWLGKVIYKDFFSDISKVPGLPFLTFFKGFRIYNTITGNGIRYEHSMLKRYGKIVRLSPNEIGLSDPEAIKAVLASTKFRKTDTYSNFQFHRDNIFSTQDVVLHRRLKRMIGPVFSNGSVAEVEPLVREAGIKRLVARIAEYANAGTNFDIMELFLYTSCDIIGEVAFGGSFNTLLCKPDEKPHPVIHWINDITYLGILKFGLGPLCHPLLFSRYFESERKLIEFTRSAILKRIQENTEQDNKHQFKNGYVKDVLQRLLESKDDETGNKFNLDEMIAQSIAMLVGGTDTTAITLTWGMYILCQYPKVMHQLKEELMAAFPDSNQTMLYNDVKQLPYLNAVILEILRMYTVATGSQRLTPPGGAVICGIYIPGNCVISPIFEAVHQNSDIYGQNPQEFRPSRWIDVEPNQLLNMRQSLMAFSMGSRACIGQNLAWMEMRLTLAHLFRQFKFTIPEDAKTDMTPMSLFILKPYEEKLYVKATNNTD